MQQVAIEIRNLAYGILRYGLAGLIFASFILGFIFLIICPAIFIWRICIFLYYGVWVKISVISALIKIQGVTGFEISEWVSRPESWIGIHKILDNIHVEIAAIALATLMGGIFFLSMLSLIEIPESVKR